MPSFLKPLLQMPLLANADFKCNAGILAEAQDVGFLGLLNYSDLALPLTNVLQASFVWHGHRALCQHAALISDID